MSSLIAKKIGMTQIFDENSNALGVTVLSIGDCRVVQIKKNKIDGYTSAQLTIGSKKNPTRPLEQHFKKYNTEPGEIIMEVQINEDFKYKPGAVLNVKDFFEIGQKVDITGISRGKGFAGVMKRHNHSGQGASHGVHKVHRGGGSIGNATFPGHVFKGQKMPGRMGKNKRTVQSVTVVGLNEEENYILVNGSVPGSKGNIVKIQSAIKVKK